MNVNHPVDAAMAHQPTRHDARLPALRRFYTWAEPISFAMLRACFGVVMVTHGLPKLMRTSHGSMADPMAASTRLIETVLGLPLPGVFAMFVALLEGVGGAMLALGLGTRVIAPMMAVQMLAICYILGPTWVWIDRGIEFPVLMLFVTVFLSVKGSGRYSLDRAMGWDN